MNKIRKTTKILPESKLRVAVAPRRERRRWRGQRPPEEEADPERGAGNAGDDVDGNATAALATVAGGHRNTSVGCENDVADFR